MQKIKNFFWNVKEAMADAGAVIKDAVQGKMFEFLATIMMVMSIVLYTLGPIYDFENLRNNGMTLAVNFRTIFESAHRGGGSFGLMTFFFFLIDFIKDKKIYGTWENPRSKIVRMIVQGIFMTIFYVLVLLARRGLMSRIFGII